MLVRRGGLIALHAFRGLTRGVLLRARFGFGWLAVGLTALIAGFALIIWLALPLRVVLLVVVLLLLVLVLRVAGRFCLLIVCAV